EAPAVPRVGGLAAGGGDEVAVLLLLAPGEHPDPQATVLPVVLFALAEEAHPLADELESLLDPGVERLDAAGDLGAGDVELGDARDLDRRRAVEPAPHRALGDLIECGHRRTMGPHRTGGGGAEMAVESRADALWEGDLIQGRGSVHPASGAFPDVSLTWRQRAETRESGTSPEELIAAAHAGCFAMALSFGLGNAGHPPERLE